MILSCEYFNLASFINYKAKDNHYRIYMPLHGDYNEDLRKWYCSYWLTAEEWEDIHDYAPSVLLDITAENNNNNNNPEGSDKDDRNE
jgi:hypothetical protein